MRGRRPGLALLCAAILVFGAGPATAAEFDTLPFEARAADGVVLRGHVFLPRHAPRPLATVLHFAPYFDGAGYNFASTEQWGAGDPLGDAPVLLDAGFAVAAVSMRGSGKSDGCLRFGDEVDRRDGAAVVQALAAQPWSNGSVGMYGHSYPAWSQFMTAVEQPPALKAIVPTSGVTDLWTLLSRRGAPLTAGLGTGFSVAFTALTGHLPPQGLSQLSCPETLQSYRDNAQLTVDGDKTEWFQERDLRDLLANSPVPVMSSVGIVSGFNDGHIAQHDGMWERLSPARTRLIFGQWSHEPPTDHMPDWRSRMVAWFDHYLRGGPQTVPGGVVEYQDDALRWHTTDRWPPAAQQRKMHLSGTRLVADGEPVEPVSSTFVSADLDPGLRGNGDEGPRTYASVCGPHQVLFASEPFSADALIAGYVTVDLELTSTLPGGNLAVWLWRTRGDGSCPDDTASWFGRAQLDLRHWQTAGRSTDFPVLTPTRFTFESHPMAAAMRSGERLVVAIGGGSTELEPDVRKPVVTVRGGSLTLPFVE